MRHFNQDLHWFRKLFHFGVESIFVALSVDAFLVFFPLLWLCLFRLVSADFVLS